MGKRIYILESKEIGQAIIDYVRKKLDENSETDRGRYSLSFIPTVDSGIIKYESVKVERTTIGE